jgi:cobyrinic acid a,c-diamide synthase
MGKEIKAILVGGTQSGVGKTTVTIGLMAAFRRRGLRVQGFKIGPDFIDPGYHTAVTGIPSRNLDGWMLPEETNRLLFARWGAEADLCIIEGAMGLFDGYGTTEEGSAAQMAKWLGVPVLLVVDAKGASRSVAATLWGFENFDKALSVRGVLFNRVGSESHAALLKGAAADRSPLDMVGALPRDLELTLPERHLGLAQAEEVLSDSYLDRLSGLIEKGVDLDQLLKIASECRFQPAGAVAEEGGRPVQKKNRSSPVRLGVAWDEAFSFYYRDNLDLLQNAGAELVYFSPIRDEKLPPSLHGLYFGGGYPELHAAGLSKNDSLIDEIRKKGENGLPIYAECGGFIYLTEGLFDGEDHAFPFVGLFPSRARMLKKRKALGYVEVRLKEDCLLGNAGTVARGHEFHYSELIENFQGRPEIRAVYEAASRKGTVVSGFQYKNTLASYVHLHFHSNPGFAEGLLASMAFPK